MPKGVWPPPLLDQVHESFDHLILREPVGLDEHRVVGRLHGSDRSDAVPLVATVLRREHRVERRGRPTGCLFAMAATGPLLGRGSEKHLELGMRKHHRTLVAALGDHVDPCGDGPLHPLHDIADRRGIRHRPRGRGDLLSADLGRHITVTDEYTPIAKGDRQGLGECREALGIVERHGSFERHERDRSIHGSGVHVEPAQAAGQRAGGGTLAGAGGTVERDVHPANSTSSCSHW